MGLAATAANKAIHATPLGKALDAAKGIGQALGLGGYGAWHSSKSYNDYKALRERALAGDSSAVAGLKLLTFPGPSPRSKYSQVRSRAREVLAQLGYTYTGSPNIEGASWVRRNGTVPSAGNGSSAGTTTAPPPSQAKPKPSPSAPAAKPKPKPCPAGSERNPATGRCRKIAAAPNGGALGIAGGLTPCKAGYSRDPITQKCRKDCKYGARLVDGSCPKKPTGLAAGKLTKGQKALVRKAETAATNVIKKGAAGATAALSAAAKAGGITAGTVAAVSLAILVAGATGWFIGQAINDRAATLEQRKANLGINRIHARKALEAQLGRMPTLAEQKPITDEYNRRLKLVEVTNY